MIAPNSDPADCHERQLPARIARELSLARRIGILPARHGHHRLGGGGEGGGEAGAADRHVFRKTATWKREEAARPGRGGREGRSGDGLLWYSERMEVSRLLPLLAARESDGNRCYNRGKRKEREREREGGGEGEEEEEEEEERRGNRDAYAESRQVTALHGV